MDVAVAAKLTDALALTGGGFLFHGSNGLPRRDAPPEESIHLFLDPGDRAPTEWVDEDALGEYASLLKVAQGTFAETSLGLKFGLAN